MRFAFTEPGPQNSMILKQFWTNKKVWRIQQIVSRYSRSKNSQIQLTRIVRCPGSS